MGLIDSNYLGLLKLNWASLRRMEKTNEFALKLGIHSFPGKFAFAQLTYLDLPLDDINDISKHIDLERINWDNTYAEDMATFLSILVTNRIPCRTWEELNTVFSIYEMNWKSKFLISLFCEAISKKGYYGNPLYYSELIGYRNNGKYHEGLINIVKLNGMEEAFNWMHRRMFLKLKSADFRKKIEKDFFDGHKLRVYPFLSFGSKGWACYNKIEKLGGMDSIFSENVPEEAKEEIYLMIISCFSSFFYAPKDTYDKIFSDINNVIIKDVIHFGADTSIAISPLFAFLQSEMGHIMANSLAGRKVAGVAGEIFDGIMKQMYLMYEGLESPEEELDFSNLYSGAPPDMIHCVKKDLVDLPIKRSKEEYKISSEYLKKLREE